MSKESALSMATTQNPITPEVRASPVTGEVPENAKEAANPAVENAGVLPESLQSTQMAHLLKKERKLLEERESFKKEREEFEPIKQKVKEAYDKALEFENTRKSDPVKALKNLGFTEKEIIDYLSAEEEVEKFTPEERAQKAAEAAIQKFKDEEAAKAEEIKKKNDSETIQRFKSQLSAVITSNPEKYELCVYNGPAAEEIMFGIALEEAKEGKISSPESIAEEVEEFYLNEWNEMKKLKKLTPKEEAVLEAAKPIERTRIVHPAQDVVKPKVTTLTNKIALTSQSLAKPSNRQETREEKRERLEAMIRAGFKK